MKNLKIDEAVQLTKELYELEMLRQNPESPKDERMLEIEKELIKAELMDEEGNWLEEIPAEIYEIVEDNS